MKPLRNALAAWEPVAAVCSDPVLQIRTAWREIVGADVAAHSRPDSLVRGSLLIVTRSNAWSQQLTFLTEQILSAVRDRTGLQLEGLRFRVGRMTAQTAPEPRALRARRRTGQPVGPPAETPQDALQRFREDVAAAERAKKAAGWKECSRCGVRISPSPARFCVPCANARVQERDGAIARLLFEAPWLGYQGIAALVGDLEPPEYHAIRLRLLRRWHDALERLRRSGSPVTTRDRMIASSYVLLKSELDPESIAPAVVRELLGDELHEKFYGSEK